MGKQNDRDCEELKILSILTEIVDSGSCNAIFQGYPSKLPEFSMFFRKV